MERKVVAYIEHRHRPGLLAAFLHAEDQEPLFQSGLQVPAGSIEPKESALDAVRREALEESGSQSSRTSIAPVTGGLSASNSR